MFIGWDTSHLYTWGSDKNIKLASYCLTNCLRANEFLAMPSMFHETTDSLNASAIADLSDLNSLNFDNQAQVHQHVCHAVHLAVGQTVVQEGGTGHHFEVLCSLLDRLG